MPSTIYFLLKGQIGTDYEGGQYIGTLTFSSNISDVPNIHFLTPNGRYDINKLCNGGFYYHVQNTIPVNVRMVLHSFYFHFIEEHNDFDVKVKLSKKEKEELIKKNKMDRKNKADGSIEYNQTHHLEIYNKLIENSNQN